MRNNDTKYKLVGTEPVPVDDLIEWAIWFETANRVVEQRIIKGVQVSTIFLGLDHQYGDGPPLLFETMIFGGEHDQWQQRYSTWDEALAGHQEALKMVNGGVEVQDKPLAIDAEGILIIKPDNTEL